MVTVPFSFQYKLGNQHGIPSKGKEIRERKLEEEDKAKCEHKGNGGALSAESKASNVRGGKQKKNVIKRTTKWIKNSRKFPCLLVKTAGLSTKQAYLLTNIDI